jgi:hypothetical protein
VRVELKSALIQLAKVGEIAVGQRILVPSVDDQNGGLPGVFGSAIPGAEGDTGGQAAEQPSAAVAERVVA